MKIHTKVINRLLCLLCLKLISVSMCYAQVTLPKLFGDNMVLQRNLKIPVWENAAPGVLVIAELDSVRTTATADKEGRRMVQFPQFKAGGPYTLKAYQSGKHDSRIELKGILIGDVWVASVKSNMEWQVQQAQNVKNEIVKANYPPIRFLFVGHDKTLTPQTDIFSGKWEVCDSANVNEFSAIAYYFALKIHLYQNVPVGIIQSAWGGTPFESWTSREMLLSSPISRASTLSNDALTPIHFVKDSLNWVRFWNSVFNPQNNTDKIIPAANYDDSARPIVEMPRLIKDFGVEAYEGMVWI